MNKMTIPNDVLLPEVGRLVARGMNVTLRVKGCSMLPFIVGDRDSVVLSKFSQLNKGDIVLAKTTRGNFVLHRIIDQKGSMLTLMGDGNIRGTEQCLVSDVSAKAISVESPGKTIDLSNTWVQRKARFWVALYPLRRWLLAFYRR